MLYPHSSEIQFCLNDLIEAELVHLYYCILYECGCRVWRKKGMQHGMGKMYGYKIDELK
jgi:hypothetical protein